MELRHLRYFIAVAEELNFTKAAQRLHTVQPSLSQQIKDLEYEVGVQLLLRTNRKVELTTAGQAFLKQAYLSVAHAEQAINAARLAAQSHKNHLNIGFLPVAEMKIFPYIMPQIRARFPELEIHFHSLTDSEQLEALYQGKIDIAFTRYVNHPTEFEAVKVFQEPLILILPKTAPETHNTLIDLASFNQQNFILSEEFSSPQLYKLIQDFFAQHKLNPKIVQYSTNILLNVNLVGMSIGWSIVPAYVTPLLGDKIMVKNTAEPLPMIDLYAVHRKNHQHEAVQLILNVLKTHFHLDFLS